MIGTESECRPYKTYDRYIIAVQTPARQLENGTFAVESAFGNHLLGLKVALDESVDRVLLVAPEMSIEEYNRQRSHLMHLNAGQDRIEFLAAHAASETTLRFWVAALPTLIYRLTKVVPYAAVVHSGLAFNIRQPMLACVNAVAWAYKKPILFVLDIDFRQDASRYFRLKAWSWPKYLANRLVLNPPRLLQIRWAVRNCSLVLLKGKELVDDYGRGLPHVKNFQDTVHSAAQVMAGEDLNDRFIWLADDSVPFTICYFGRFVWKKGLSRVLDAMAVARNLGTSVRLKLIGDGDTLDSIRGQVRALGLEENVDFHPPVAYGEALFAHLNQAHLCVMAPLIEDTPRAAFDAFARAVPVLAFDTAYFRDLAAASGAVSLTAWPESIAMAAMLVSLSRNREHIVEMATNAIRFAMENTQEIWLQRRLQWTKEFVLSNNDSLN